MNPTQLLLATECCNLGWSVIVYPGGVGPPFYPGTAIFLRYYRTHIRHAHPCLHPAQHHIPPSLLPHLPLGQPPYRTPDFERVHPVGLLERPHWDTNWNPWGKPRNKKSCRCKTVVVGHNGETTASFTALSVLHNLIVTSFRSGQSTSRCYTSLGYGPTDYCSRAKWYGRICVGRRWYNAPWRRLERERVTGAERRGSMKFAVAVLWLLWFSVGDATIEGRHKRYGIINATETAETNIQRVELIVLYECIVVLYSQPDVQPAAGSTSKCPWSDRPIDLISNGTQNR